MRTRFWALTKSFTLAPGQLQMLLLQDWNSGEHLSQRTLHRNLSRLAFR
jgi:hypothetical protein